MLLDVTPRQFLALAGDRLPARHRRALERFRYGPGVCKVDWALSGPVPWAAPACREAGTVHLGGEFAEVARGEAEVAAGRHPQRPFCLIAQPGVVDPSRAPEGRHTLWGYCHVPSGSTVDMTDRIEAQIERFAPGFRDLIRAPCARRSSGPRRGGTPTAPRCAASTCARPPPRPAAACTACAATGPPAPPSQT